MKLSTLRLLLIVDKNMCIKPKCSKSKVTSKLEYV